MEGNEDRFNRQTVGGAENKLLEPRGAGNDLLFEAEPRKLAAFIEKRSWQNASSAAFCEGALPLSDHKRNPSAGVSL
jgi:hypothetical protein